MDTSKTVLRPGGGGGVYTHLDAAGVPSDCLLEVRVEDSYHSEARLLGVRERVRAHE